MNRAYLKVIVILINLILLGCSDSSKSGEETHNFNVCYELLDRSPEDIEREITIPVENVLSDIDGIVSIFSSSSDNEAKITLEVLQEQDIEMTVMRIKKILELNRAKLPENTSAPVVLYVTNSTKSTNCK